MNYIKAIVLMVFFSPVFINAAQVSLRWMRPALSLPKLVELAKIKQGSDRLIVSNAFNNKAIFAELNGRILPFLPESTDTFGEREKIREKRNELRQTIKDLAYSRDSWGCVTGVLAIPPVVGVAIHFCFPFLDSELSLGLIKWSFLPVVSGALGYRNYKCQAKHTNTLVTLPYRSIGAWDAENTDVNFASSDKIMLMHKRDNAQVKKDLESDVVTWYCPHDDWTKLAGPGVVNVQQVLTPCEETDSQALPVVALRNIQLFRQFNDFTKTILSSPAKD